MLCDPDPDLNDFLFVFADEKERNGPDDTPFDRCSAYAHSCAVVRESVGSVVIGRCTYVCYRSGYHWTCGQHIALWVSLLCVWKAGEMDVFYYCWIV